MKRILLPTDFSENSINAIMYALRLFKSQKVTFYLLHTYTPAAYNVGSMADSYSALELQKATHENAVRSMEAIVQKMEPLLQKGLHEVERIITFNLLTYEIQDVVSDKGIDLVIMGTQGATGAKEIFIGTQTMYTIKKAQCPVLAIPNDYVYQPPTDILFPTDFKVASGNPGLHMIRELCDAHQSKLHLLNAYYGVSLKDEQKETKAYLDAFFKDNIHEFHLAENTDVPGAIAAFQQKNSINLLVMVHNKHSFFENLLFTPVINQIAYHTSIPFLVIPSQERMLKAS